jgi:hypothetical protein
LPIKVEPLFRERIERSAIESIFGSFNVQRTGDTLTETSQEQAGAVEPEMRPSGDPEMRSTSIIQFGREPGQAFGTAGR